MSPASDYALLSADAYRDARQLDLNYAPIPLGWTELKQYAVSGSGETAPVGGNGFSFRRRRSRAKCSQPRCPCNFDPQVVVKCLQGAKPVSHRQRRSASVD